MSCQLLLVDDEPNVPKSIRRALRSQQYAIHIASSGMEALELLEKQPIDVVVSDHRMPGMTGAELLREVSAKYPSIVNVMLSGQADMNAVIDAVNEGNIYKFLHKPWSNDALRSTVAEAAGIAESRKEKDASAVMSQHQFCESVPTEAYAAKASLVLLEIRNSSELRTLKNFEVVHAEFFAELAQYCQTLFGKPFIPMQSLEGNLLACVHPQFNPQIAETFFLDLAKSLPSFVQLRPVLAMGYSSISDDISSAFSQALSALTASASGEATQFSEKIGKRIHLRQSLEAEMRSALPNNEFYLDFQPQVSCKDGTIRGLESLCRWEHPTKGKISPEIFIDLAEQTGFINQLGLWVIEHGCHSLATLQSIGINNVRLSVNVSPRQFSQRTWVDAVLKFLESRNMSAEFLELEITESSMMSNANHTLKVVSELRERGVRIAMDDFGTGHSSLGQINQLPIDVLKLDRSLVIDVEHNEKSRKLLRNLLSMAQDLGFETIVEGVETEAQAIFCREYGCDLIQGYFYYKPMKIDKVVEIYGEELLTTRHSQL
ncbi:MAG: EAL domain-containing protein [Pseudomonadales bacterium]